MKDMGSKKQKHSEKIDWDNLDPDEPLTITLLRPSLAILLKNAKTLRRRTSQKARRRKSTSTNEK